MKSAQHPRETKSDDVFERILVVQAHLGWLLE
jgi:hypothetical protein